MVEIGCTCNWDIPGIDRLPPHSHRFIDVLADADGKEYRVPAGTTKSGWELVTALEEIHIWVPWKELAKRLLAA